MFDIHILIKNSRDIHRGEPTWARFLFIASISILVGKLVGYDRYVDICERFVDVAVNVIGILLGFVMAMVALIASGDNDGINAAKKYPILKTNKDKSGKPIEQQVKSLGKPKTAYDMLVVDLTLCTVLNALSLVALIAMIVFVQDGTCLGYAMFFVQVFLLLYCVIMSVVNMLHIFLVFSAKRD